MKQILGVLSALVLMGLLVLSGPASAAPVVAYSVPFGTQGDQNYTGGLGMDFNVLQDIQITSLGVFDDGSDGLNREITVRLYDRNNASTPLGEMVFATGDTGDLIGGSRFMELAQPLELVSGFQGSIVAFGYGRGEANGNSNGTTPLWTVNDGGGLLAFVGLSRFDLNPDGLPGDADGGPFNRYAAGTFMYGAAGSPVPLPGALVLLGTGLLTLTGRKRHQ